MILKKKYLKVIRFFYSIGVVFYVDPRLIRDFLGLELGGSVKTKSYSAFCSFKYYAYLNVGNPEKNKREYLSIPINCIIKRRNFTLALNLPQKTAYIYLKGVGYNTQRMLSSLVNLSIAEFLWEHDMLLMHAACVSKNKRAILIPGQAVAGKTCTMLYLLKAGFHPVSEDLSILYKKNGKIFIHGLIQKIKMKTYSLMLFPEFSALKQGNRRIIEIVAEDFFPQPRDQDCRVDFICIPKANFLSSSFGKNIDIKLSHNIFIFLISAVNIFFPELSQRTNAKLKFLSPLVNQCKIIPFHFSHTKRGVERNARRLVNSLADSIV